MMRPSFGLPSHAFPGAVDSLLQRVSPYITSEISKRFGARLGMWHVIEYPKSGGTWLSRVLSDALGIPFPQRSRLPVAMPALIQTHSMPGNLLPSRPIYLVRDGRDVVVSMYFHLSNLFRGRFNVPISRRLEVFRKLVDSHDPAVIRDRLPDFISLLLTRPLGVAAPWQDHVAAWTDPRLSGVKVVRYEALVADMAAVLRQCFSHFAVTVADQRLYEAIDRSSFLRMTGRQSGEEVSTEFLRKGVVGDWRNYFTRPAAEAFHSRAGSALVHVGYEDSDSWVHQL